MKKLINWLKDVITLHIDGTEGAREAFGESDTISPNIFMLCVTGIGVVRVVNLAAFAVFGLPDTPSERGIFGTVYDVAVCFFLGCAFTFFTFEVVVNIYAIVFKLKRFKLWREYFNSAESEDEPLEPFTATDPWEPRADGAASEANPREDGKERGD